jgi:hypothetical protein
MRLAVRAVLALAILAIVFFQSSSLAAPRPTSPETAARLLSWAEAVARDPSIAEQFRKPSGIPYCSPPDPVLMANPPSPPLGDGPTCFARPEDQGLLIPADPGSATHQFAPAWGSDPPPNFLPAGEAAYAYRFGTSKTNYNNFEKARNLAEVSNPSICYSNCPTSQHFYSRMSAFTPAGNAIEIGWVESNHPPWTGDYPVIMSVVDPTGLPQNPMFHTAYFLVIGAEYFFKLGQCGYSGAYDVCMQFWDGSSWVILRQWLGTMRCEDGSGNGNCWITWSQEASAYDDVAWFNINGGSDGLRMRDMQVRTSSGNWYQFATGLGFSGRWIEESPYSICRISHWYHFTFFHGSPSC